MPVELIAPGTGEAASADIVVSAPVTIAASSDDGGDFSVLVEMKSSAGVYSSFARLTRRDPILVIVAPFTYRVRRTAGSALVDRSDP